METGFTQAVTRLWPGYSSASFEERSAWLSDVISLLYSAPLALAGLYWLVTATRLSDLRQHAPLLLLVLGLVFILRQLDVFGFAEIRTGLYADWGSSLDSIVTWSAALLLGPVALWPSVLLLLLNFALHWRQYSAIQIRLLQTRHLSLDLAEQAFLALVALALYQSWGGTFPLEGLQSHAVLLAVLGTLTWYALSRLLWGPYFILAFIPMARPATQPPASDKIHTLSAMLQLYVITDLLPAFISPFAVLAAGLYSQNGLGLYLFMNGGMLLIALLGHLLSMTAERSYHRTRELETLDRLSTAIINAPLDASTLPELLQSYVPGMFPDSQIEIRIFPERTLLRSFQYWPAVPEPVWDWLMRTEIGGASYYTRGSQSPWDNRLLLSSFLLAPILAIESGAVIGGVCVMVRWPSPGILPYFLPALQSLAVEVAAALHQAEVYERSLANERVTQELALAGEIQASLLPRALPDLLGWQLSAVLEPTRETSGDFYDWIPLSGGRIGLVIADVADKGLGSALYMTLSRTLLRSYALDLDGQPDRVLAAINRRLLYDANADLFVSVFYGVLDPGTGSLEYCNAGHNPPLLIGSGPKPSAGLLTRTGMALGVIEDTDWEKACVQIAPGGVLLMYTDGLTDAESPEGNFFDEKRLLECARQNLAGTAEQILSALMDRVHAFAGDAPVGDDVTVFILKREL